MNEEIQALIDFAREPEPIDLETLLHAEPHLCSRCQQAIEDEPETRITPEQRAKLDEIFARYFGPAEPPPPNPFAEVSP